MYRIALRLPGFFGIVALTSCHVSTPEPAASSPPAAASPIATGGGLSSAEQRIVKIAAGSRIARYDWKGEQGPCPIGYTKGMALVYARMYCRLADGDPVAVALAKKAGSDPSSDALARYAPDFAGYGMRNDRDGADTMRHLFALMFHMGMQETSGRWWKGKDPKNKNPDPATAESGLFQASYNSIGFHPRMRPLFQSYRKHRSGLVEVFREGVRGGWEPDHGSGEVAEFQRVSKDCPSFSVEYVALGIRAQCRDWWPIKHHEAELHPDADAMLLEVQKAVDEMRACGTIDW